MSRVERLEAREERAARQAELDMQQAQAAKPKKKKKKGSGCGCLVVLILILAVLVGAGGYYTYGLMPVDPDSEDKVVVEIPSGSGASAIVDILDEAGLVERVGVDRDLHIVLFCHAEAVINGSRRGAPVFVEL